MPPQPSTSFSGSVSPVPKAMGWAGYLGSEVDVNVKGDAAVQLGLGAREIEDATGWVPRVAPQFFSVAGMDGLKGGVILLIW